MVDANMRWSVDEAIRAARALRDFDLVWLEEPIIPDDVPGHARVVREGGLPVAAGENLHTLHEFRALIDAGGVTFPLLAAVPTRSYLEAHGFGLDRYIAEPLRLEEGRAVAPDTPGHGV